MNVQPINDQTWAEIRTEFTLPALQQVHRRLSELMEDPTAFTLFVGRTAPQVRGSSPSAR